MKDKLQATLKEANPHRSNAGFVLSGGGGSGVLDSRASTLTDGPGTPPATDHQHKFFINDFAATEEVHSENEGDDDNFLDRRRSVHSTTSSVNYYGN